MHVLCFYDAVLVVMQLSTAIVSIFVIQSSAISYAVACAKVSRLGSRVLKTSRLFKLLMSTQNLQSSSAFKQYAGSFKRNFSLQSSYAHF